MTLGGFSGRLGVNELSFHSMWDGAVAGATIDCSLEGLDENPQWLQRRKMLNRSVGQQDPLLGLSDWLLLQRWREIGSIGSSCRPRGNGP